MTTFVMTLFITALPTELPAESRVGLEPTTSGVMKAFIEKWLGGDDRSQDDASPPRDSSDALGRAQHLLINTLHPVIGFGAAVGEVFHEGENFIAKATDIEDVATIWSLCGGIGG